MKILIIPNNTDNNCYRLRNGLPKKYLEELGHEVRLKQEFSSYKHPLHGMTIDPGEDFDWAEVVVFNRHYDIDSKYIQSLMRYAKDQGKKVIYETDDMLDILDKSNPAYSVIQGNEQSVKMMMMEADVCTTTGEFIASKIADYNPNVRVLPNCIVPAEWTPRPKKSKKIRVGWAGGCSHAEDLKIIMEVIKSLQKDIDFEFVIFGMSPEPWEEYISNLKEKHKENMKKRPGAKPAQWYSSMIDLAGQLKNIKFIHEPFVPLKDYAKKLSELDLDIGLCPLVDTDFNKCKSAIKFYEYAMVDTVTLASNITPYKEEVGLLVKNRYGKWKTKLKKLIEDKAMREFHLMEQKDWVLENRTMKNNIDKWEKVYSEIIL